MLTRLKARQRKRLQASADEEQRAATKCKASKAPNKRSVATTSGCPEQSSAKRKQKQLTPELFASSACTSAASSDPFCDSAVQPTSVRKQEQMMHRLAQETSKLSSHAWIVGDADARRKVISLNAYKLQRIPATAKILKLRSLSSVVFSRAGFGECWECEDLRELKATSQQMRKLVGCYDGR